MTPPRLVSVITLTPKLFQFGLFKMATLLALGGFVSISAMMLLTVLPVGKHPLTTISAADLVDGIAAFTRWVMVRPPIVVLGMFTRSHARVSLCAMASSRVSCV